MPFRGGQLASDDDMLPESMRGYAPVVRGIARSHAQIVIRQNGYVIYQDYVAPGAFEINDMYPTGGSGDLNVIIKEADGSEQNFIVPYASLPILQREGRLKYALTAGQYRSWDRRVDKTPFGQMTGILGAGGGFTLYGGFQESAKYQSIAGGLGRNLGDIGALSSDVTQAWSHPQGRRNRPDNRGAYATAKICSPPAPISLLRDIATQPAVTTLCRKRWTRGESRHGEPTSAQQNGDDAESGAG